MKYFLKNIFWFIIFLISLAIYSTGTLAQPVVPDFDIRGEKQNSTSSPNMPLLPEQSKALNNLLSGAPGQVNIRWNSFNGVPSRIVGQGAMLTMPKSAPPHAIADAFLMQYRLLFNLTVDDIQTMRLDRDFETVRTGVKHLSFQQVVNGIDVFGAGLNLHIDSLGRVVSVSGEPVPDASNQINTTDPLITDLEAVDLAAAAIGVSSPVNVSIAGLIYFPIAPDNLLLGWRLSFEDSATPNAYDAIVDATDGTVLWWENLTEYDHFSTHGEVYTSDSPRPVTPKGTAYDDPRDDAPFDGRDFFPHDDSHYDWWAGGSRTTTTSNNVDAYADRDGDNVADAGSRPTAVADDFTFAIDLINDQPNVYQNAAVTNLFYWNNRIHDFFYVLGFDEAARNFQTDNFGLGGSGGDAVRAEAQDAADADPYKRCNANMKTWPDGTAPRMQMYICGGPPDYTSGGLAIARDGDLDTIVITHEYTHGVHNRLVATSGNQRANEGWCDYFGLAIIAEPDDPYDGLYGAGDYLMFGNGDGIRYAPYSTDLTVFDLTYADLNGAASCEKRTCQQKLCSDGTTECNDDGDCSGTDKCDTWPGHGTTTCKVETEDTDCATGDPVGELCGPTRCQYHEDCIPPIADVDQGLCLTSVYRTGEIWANALWKARMNIIYKYGFAAGDRTMNELVVDGMILSDPNPTLLDGRDMLIAADLVYHNGANECLIWDAFASMGMGYSADTTGVNDINPLEAYNVPTWCSPVIQANAPNDFGNVCVNGSSEKQLSIYNTGSGDLIVTSVEVVSGSTDISVDSMPETPVFISADGQVDFTVYCEPTTAGAKTATVRITSNDSGNPMYDIVYTCFGGEADMELFIANAGNFGDVCIDDFKDLDLTIQNNGTCDLAVTSITSNDTHFIIPGGSPSMLVEAGNSVRVPIRFQPQSIGSDSGTITVVGSDGSSSVSVEGNSPPPDIQVAIANSGDFGEVCKGDHADLDLTLFNQGRCDLTISSINITQTGTSFELPTDTTFPLVLSHDAEFTLPIRYAPDVCNDAGESATIVVNSDDPDEDPVTIGISGSSPCPNLIIDPADVTGIYAFPATVVDADGSLGCYSDETVILRNTGTCPLTITDINIGSSEDFSVIAPTVFPVIVPSGEETLAVKVRFKPQSDANPLAPGEVSGQLTIISDDPDGDAYAGLCGESVAQSGVRILVTDISSGSPVMVDSVDVISIDSKGKNIPSPIKLRFTDQPLSSATVCEKDIYYHINQETLPEVNTTGSNPKSSYTAKAQEMNLQASESFGLGQCELRDFQLQLVDQNAPDCLLKLKGESCVTDGECCSGKCRGNEGNKVCR